MKHFLELPVPYETLNAYVNGFYMMVGVVIVLGLFRRFHMRLFK